MSSLLSEEESWYVTGGLKYHNLFLTAHDAHECHQRAGFVIRYSAQFPVPENARNVFNDCKGIHFLVVQKKVIGHLGHFGLEPYISACMLYTLRLIIYMNLALIRAK